MIGEKLVELRRAKGWTQSDLSKKTGISRVVISRYESNTTPSKTNFKKLLKAFQLPSSYFYDQTVLKSETAKIISAKNSKLSRLASDFMSLSVDDQNIVLSLVQSFKEKKKGA